MEARKKTVHWKIKLDVFSYELINDYAQVNLNNENFQMKQNALHDYT